MDIKSLWQKMDQIAEATDLKGIPEESCNECGAMMGECSHGMMEDADPETKAAHTKGYADAQQGKTKNPYNPGSPLAAAYDQGQEAHKRHFGESSGMFEGVEFPDHKQRGMTNDMLQQMFYDFAKQVAKQYGVQDKSPVQQLAALAQQVAMSSGDRKEADAKFKSLIKKYFDQGMFEGEMSSRIGDKGETIRKHTAKAGGYGRKIDKDDESGDAFHSSDIDDTDDAPAAQSAVKRGRGRPMKGGDSETGQVKQYDTDALASWIIGNKPKNMAKIGTVSKVHRLKEYMSQVETNKLFEGVIAEGKMSEVAAFLQDILDEQIDIYDIIVGKYKPVDAVEKFVVDKLKAKYEEYTRTTGDDGGPDAMDQIYSELDDIISGSQPLEEVMATTTQPAAGQQTQQQVPIRVNGQVVGMAPDQATAQQATQKMTQNANNQKELAKMGVSSINESAEPKYQLVMEGMTLEEILDLHPHEHKMCQEGWGMDESLYEALCDHYFKEGRIPRKVWHGSLEELRNHVEECYMQDTQTLIGESPIEETAPITDVIDATYADPGMDEGALRTDDHAMTDLVDEIDEEFDAIMKNSGIPREPIRGFVPPEEESVFSKSAMMKDALNESKSEKKPDQQWRNSLVTSKTVNTKESISQDDFDKAALAQGKRGRDARDNPSQAVALAKKSPAAQDARATLDKVRQYGKVEEESTEKRDSRAEKAGKKVTKDLEYDMKHKGKDDNKAERAGKKVTKDIEWDEKHKVNEISKSTLGSYVKKATKDVDDRSRLKQKYKDSWPMQDRDPIAAVDRLIAMKQEKIDKRHSGIDKAVDRITKESQLDEKDMGKHNNATTGFKALAKKAGGGEKGAKIAGAQFQKMKKAGQLEEESAKPDYIDLDKDGDKKESMKKAAADKKKIKEMDGQSRGRDNDDIGKKEFTAKPKKAKDAAKDVGDALNKAFDKATPKKKVKESAEYSEWDLQLNSLLNEDLTVNTTSSSNPESNSVNVSATADDAENLMALLKNAGMGVDAPASQEYEPEDTGACAPEETSIEFDREGNGIAELVKRMMGAQGGEADYAVEVMENFDPNIFTAAEDSYQKDDGAVKQTKTTDIDQDGETYDGTGSPALTTKTPGSDPHNKFHDAGDVPVMAMPRGMGVSQNVESDVAEVVEPIFIDEVIEGLENEDTSDNGDSALAHMKRFVLEPEQKTSAPAADDSDEEVKEDQGDGNLANNAKPYDKVTQGDVIAGRLGKDAEGGEKEVKEGDITTMANGDNDEEQSEVSSDAVRDAALAGMQPMGATNEAADEPKRERESLADFMKRLDSIVNKHPEKQVKLDEWANSSNDEGSDESFETDMEFMTKTISGGLNNQKQDQTLVGSGPTRVQTQDERKEVDNTMGAMLRKLDGING